MKTTKTSKDKAVDAPMCKICRTKHWQREPHNFPPVKAKKKAKPRGKSKAARNN